MAYRELHVVEGLEDACAEAGVANAVLRGSIGSVNHAVLETGAGRTQLVDQPGLEVKPPFRHDCCLIVEMGEQRRRRPRNKHRWLLHHGCDSL